MTTAAQPTPAWQDTLAQEGSRLLDAMREVTPQVTEAVVRYVWATGFTGVVIGIVVFVIFGGLGAYLISRCGRTLDKLPNNIHRDLESTIGWNTAGLLAGVVSIFLSFIVCCSWLYHSLPTALAPEGAAVMMALKALNGGQ